MALSEQELAAVTTRNALLRAWKAYGVPLEGHWEEASGHDRTSLGDAVAKLKCGACGRHLMLGLSEDRGPDWHIPYYKNQICEHLLPLVGPVPPEVLAMAEMELLAGEG